MSIDERLGALKKTIKERKEPQQETVRTVLSWFGFERRGSRVLAQMERAFSENQLCTTPALSEPWIDGVVEINLDEAGKAEAQTYDALIARLAHLDAANQEPARVKRDQALDVATAMMLRHDYSQLPVMRDDRNVEGFISWRTIGEARALGYEPQTVRECMDKRVRVLDSKTPLTDAIDAIVEHEFVMVKTADAKIRGPVTTTDLSGRYHALAQPFLLIGQIESALRKVLAAHAPVAVLEAAKHGDDEREVKRPEDLSFSEYKAAIGHEDVWPKLGLRICKSEFMGLLEDVRIARNDVMHFHPDDGEEGAVLVLQNAARMLDKVAAAAVPRSAVR